MQIVSWKFVMKKVKKIDNDKDLSQLCIPFTAGYIWKWDK